MFYHDEGEEGTDDEEEWSNTVQDDVMHAKLPTQVCHERVIVHIDIDCFYAQVEMIADPALQDKPLGIQQKNILVTCNYVAREHGLTKLMFLKDAQQKCPDLVIRNGEDLTKYRNMSEKIFKVLLQYSPLVEKLGLDENFVDVTALVDVPPWKDMVDCPVEGHVYGGPSQQVPCSCGCVRRLTIGSHICREIRRALHADLGITSCGGVSHNKLLAKVVGEKHKPNAQTVLFAGQERQLMESLGSVRKVPGIGHTMSKSLAPLGVLSVADLTEQSMEALSRSLGHHTAERLLQLAQGIDMTTVTPTGKPQSMSDEDSFKKCSSVPDFKSRTSSLVTSLLHRLMTDGRYPATLRLSLRKFDPNRKYFNRESRQRPLPAAILHNLNSENLHKVSVRLTDLCLDLFHKMIDSTKPFHLTLINVCFTKFCDVPERNSIGAFLKAKEETDNEKEKEEGESKTSVMAQQSQASTSITSALSEDYNLNKIDTTNLDGEIVGSSLAVGEIRSPHKKQKISEESHTIRNSFFKQRQNDSDDKTIGQSQLHIDTPLQGSTTSHQNMQMAKAVEITKTELPDAIDQEMFNELPKDIQEEILKSQHILKSNCDQSKGKRLENVNVNTGTLRTESEILKTDSSGPQECSRLSNPSKSLSLDSRHSSNSMEVLDKTNLTPTKLPPGIDPTVFSQLPPDVQKAVLSEHHAQNVEKEFVEMKSTKSPTFQKAKKSGKGRTQTNIANFFKKK